jgi:hypothetical protein
MIVWLLIVVSSKVLAGAGAAIVPALALTLRTLLLPEM